MSGIYIYHQWVLPKSSWKLFRRARWIWGDAYFGWSDHPPLGIRGAARNDSRNRYSHAGELRIRITGVLTAITYIQTQPHMVDGLSGKWEINYVTGSSGRGTGERTATVFCWRFMSYMQRNIFWHPIQIVCGWKIHQKSMLRQDSNTITDNM